MPGSIDFETRTTTQLGLLGRDDRGVHFELLCEPGDRVRAGVAVMRDARRPEILFSAPAAGRVSMIERGARRKLLTLQIDADESQGVVEFAAPSGRDQESQRAFMLESGSWSSLRTRPFGNIPNPLAQPAAIFITAIDAEPLAPPVAAIIDAFADEFSAAVSMLARISDAPLYLCHAPGHHPPFDEASGVRCKEFAGGTTAGLPGRHIQSLCPLGFTGAEVCISATRKQSPSGICCYTDVPGPSALSRWGVMPCDGRVVCWYRRVRRSLNCWMVKLKMAHCKFWRGQRLIATSLLRSLPSWVPASDN